MRRRARVDGNQASLVNCLRGLGASFQHTHTIPGALDGIVGYVGIDQRVEIKDPEQPPSGRRLTKLEQDVFDQWMGRRPVVLETIEDCVNLLRKMRAVL